MGVKMANALGGLEAHVAAGLGSAFLARKGCMGGVTRLPGCCFIDYMAFE